jgi:hypothetical protein
MKEGIILLPEKIVNGIGLDRNHCYVDLLERPEGILLRCSKKNCKTIGGCRTKMNPNDPNYFHGCTLRDFPKPEYILERWGITLTQD